MQITYWFEAIWEVLSTVLKLVFVILQKGWVFLLGTITIMATIWATIVEIGVAIAYHLSAAWAILNEASNGYELARVAGWPPSMATGIAMLNRAAPVTEIVAYASTLIGLLVIFAAFRAMKSILPLFNT